VVDVPLQDAFEVQALIERQLRCAMEAHDILELPLYPEERATKRPTAEQAFRLLALAQRHTLISEGRPLRTFHPELTPLQQQVLELLEVPENTFSCPPPPHS